jgi:hypothetical protein
MLVERNKNRLRAHMLWEFLQNPPDLLERFISLPAAKIELYWRMRCPQGCGRLG